jgi:hypothetical protein
MFASVQKKNLFVLLADSRVWLWHARKLKRNFIITAVVTAGGIGIGIGMVLNGRQTQHCCLVVSRRTNYSGGDFDFKYASHPFLPCRLF